MYSYTTCRIQFYGDGFDDVSFQKFYAYQCSRNMVPLALI